MKLTTNNHQAANICFISWLFPVLCIPLSCRHPVRLIVSTKPDTLFYKDVIRTAGQ